MNSRLLTALHPVTELLLAVQAGQDIRDDDWQLLANYSWDQDRGMALGDGNLHLALRNMAAACPDRLAATKSKLQMLAVGAWARDKKRDESLAPQYMVDVQRILQDEALARDNLSLFITAGADIVKAMPGQEQAAALREQIATLLATTVGDTSMGVLARIEAIYAWVEVNKTALPEDGELSAAQQDWVKAQVAATRSQVNNYQQHTALNTISQIYLNAGLVPEARTTLLEGIEISSQPYYFMSGMAYLEKQAGNADAAIAWHKQAWDAAQGPATRIQWGSNYLFALIALSPDDIEGIRAAGTILFNELAQQKDGLHQRTSGRMNRLSRTLLAWAEPAAGETTTAQQRQLVLDQLRSQMDKLCSGAAPEGEGFATCESFLEPGAAA